MTNIYCLEQYEPHLLIRNDALGDTYAPIRELEDRMGRWNVKNSETEMINMLWPILRDLQAGPDFVGVVAVRVVFDSRAWTGNKLNAGGE